MKKRYTTGVDNKSQYQPNSQNTVLVNKLGITSKEEIDNTELSLLNMLYEEVLTTVDIDQQITIDDIIEWHRKWLGNIYLWAGEYRTVNMSKNDFHFAIAMQISKLMNEFNINFLRKFTPCNEMKVDTLIHAIAVVHIEFILIHPFREGNGRLARLVTNIMALQAGFPELDFTVLDTKKDKYFQSIQMGMNCDYKPLENLIRQVLQDSQKALDSGS